MGPPIALMFFELSYCFKAGGVVTCAVQITKACQQGCSSHTGLSRSCVALSSGTQDSASFVFMLTLIKKHYWHFGDLVHPATAKHFAKGQ